MLDLIEQWLHRELPDFVVAQREMSDRVVQVTIRRGEAASCRIRIVPHFLEHHYAPLEIETFFEHHGLQEKILAAGTQTIVIDNAGIHFRRGVK